MSSTSKRARSDTRMVELIARRSVANIVRTLALAGPLTCRELTSATQAAEVTVRRDLAVLTQSDFVNEFGTDSSVESRYALNDSALAAAAAGHVDCVLGR